LEKDRIIMTIRCSVDARDSGMRLLKREYDEYKKTLLPKVQEAVRKVIKDKEIEVHSREKWGVDQPLTRYVNNLPLHPMPFHKQSVWIEDRKGGFFIHFDTKEGKGKAVCYLTVPQKYREQVLSACGEKNPVLGQAELIEDKKYGRFNVHLTLRLPYPEPYETSEWVGVDVGWHNLAVSALVEQDKVSEVTFHAEDYKTRVIQLKYLLKQNQRAKKRWDYKLQNTIRQATGFIAKEIVEKARRNRAGVAMEALTFPSHTKRYLIPRYKLAMAIKTLCERQGIPFKFVDPAYTSLTCNKCGYIDKRSRIGEVFKCLKCGYQVNADLNASVNIGREAIAMGYTPLAKESEAIGLRRRASHKPHKPTIVAVATSTDVK
jgi:IS605 OrfB family transposase